ncbi:hypothetical protein AcV5_002731 [Taiwanofungus camphoratus]|nr:hypothetical protein AcV5_002731 [Antrodia cinnamomea]
MTGPEDCHLGICISASSSKNVHTLVERLPAEIRDPLCPEIHRKWTANLSQVVHNKKTSELYGKDGKLAEVFLTTDGSAEKLAGLLPIYYIGITIPALVDSLLSSRDNT